MIQCLIKCSYANTFSAPSNLAPVTSFITTRQTSLFREILEPTTVFGQALATDTSESMVLVSNILKATDKYVPKYKTK